LTRTDQNTAIAGIGDAFGSICTYTDQIYLVEQNETAITLLFIKQYFLQMIDEFQEIIFTSPDKTARLYFGTVISHAFKKMWFIYQNIRGETPGIKAIKEFAESSLDKLMSLVGSKLCLENWNKFNAFFKCIYDIIKVNVTATRYLIRKDTIKNLIDFMLGNESPYATERRIPMGGSGQA